jgi:hypothetical protein
MTHPLDATLAGLVKGERCTGKTEGSASVRGQATTGDAEGRQDASKGRISLR